MSAAPPTKPWWKSRIIWTGVALVLIPALSLFATLLGDGTPFDRKDAVLVAVAALGGLVLWLRTVTTQMLESDPSVSPSSVTDAEKRQG